MLNGLIYVHRISDPKVSRISKRNLRLFKQLCGDGSLKNVCIITTNWSRVTKEEGDRRELELRESPDFFKPLIDEGAQLTRHDNGITSARSIVNFLTNKDPTKLQIQIELDAGLTLENTSTGAGLHDEEILELKAKQKAEMLALTEEMEKAAREKHAELSAELEKERQKWETQRKKLEEDLENVKKQARSDKEEMEAKVSNAFGELEGKITELRGLVEQQAQRDMDNDKSMEAASAQPEEPQPKADQGRWCVIG